MSVTAHDQVQSGFVDKVAAVLSASTGACGTDNYGHAQPGLNVITYDGGAGAYTLPSPVAGAPNPPSGSAASLGITANGGDDGKRVRIVTTKAHAHTVTTGNTKINGASNTITFAAAVGCMIELVAYGGQWYVDTASTSCTLSEV